MLALLALAWGAELRLEPSPGATVQVLPPVAPARVDVLIHRNTANLRAQVRDPYDGLRSARALDLGGDWVVTVWLKAPTDTAELLQEGGAWRVHAVPAPPRDVGETPAPPTLDELHAGIEVAACPVTPLPLSPLAGHDAIWGFDAHDFAADLPMWTEAEPPGPASWASVTLLRRVMPKTHAKRERARVLYALGAMHRDLGHAREAAYYFDSAATLTTESEGLADLQRAGALLRVRKWDAAVQAAWDAYAQGAPDEAVIEVLGIAAIADAGPSPVAVGRALAAASPRPDLQMIAGTLLSREHCTREAVVALRAAEAGLTGEPQQVARLLLTDALLLDGAPLDADDVLARVETRLLRPQWQGLARARGRLLPMLLQTPDQWLASVPTLQLASTGEAPDGAESLWLLGQIYEKLGEDRAALDAYGELVDRYHKLGEGVPGERLVHAWNGRVAALLRMGRPVEAMGLHMAAWRPVMGRRMLDPGPLPELARAYADASLLDRALSVLQDVTDIQGRVGADSHATAVDVAALYLRMGRPQEALDATNWVLRAKTSPALDAPAQDLRGQAYAALGRADEARAAYTALLGDPALGPHAGVRIGLLDAAAGRCAAAVTRLAPLVEQVGGADQAEARAARDRCLVALGRAPEASAPPGDATLTAVAQEDAADAAFQERLRAYRPTM